METWVAELAIAASNLGMERNWKRLLKKHKPLQLIAAGDALTAKLIQQAGFPAYQVGGFALDGMRFGFPDMDVNRWVRNRPQT
jgi:2-methylisocitrate lyase-like PEP mutase family enzyme